MEGLSTTKTKKFRVKHPKRKLYRSSEPLLSVFMWGINHTVRELSHISIPVMLMPDDFRAFSKIKIDNHAFNKENLPSHFKVIAIDIRLNCIVKIIIHFLNFTSFLFNITGERVLPIGFPQPARTIRHRRHVLHEVVDESAQADGLSWPERS